MQLQQTKLHIIYVVHQQFYYSPTNGHPFFRKYVYTHQPFCAKT